MKKSTISLVFILLFSFSIPHTQSVAENNCLVPIEPPANTLLDNRRVYFTYPSADHENLVLWYADETGSHETDLLFPPPTILRLNPAGSYIAAVEFVGEHYMYGDIVYEYGGETLNAIDIVDTSTMQRRTLPLPEDWVDIAFNRRVVWLDDVSIMLLTAMDHHGAGILNTSTGEFETLDWLNRLSYPYIPYEGGGLMALSPSGDYLYYTQADPFVPSIHWSRTPRVNVLPWTIIDWDGKEILDYRGGVGAFTRWFDEGSIITLDTESNDLLRISLDGTVQRLTNGILNFYYRYLVSPGGARVALTTEVAERNGFHQEQLAILNTETGEITHYCVDAIRLGKEIWSSDERLLVYVAYSISDSLEGTDIFALDTIDHHQISLPGYRYVENDAIGRRFIRVVGIREYSGD